MKSRLTTDELRFRALVHRRMAEFKPAFDGDPKAASKNTLMAETQSTIAEVYEELIERREQNHENS